MVSDEQLSPIGESSVPVPNRMLRRLKKAKTISDLCPGSEIIDSEEADGEDLENHATEEDDGMQSDRVNARKVLDFDYVPEFNHETQVLSEKRVDEISDLKLGEEIRFSGTEEAGNEQPDLELPESDSVIEESREKGEEEITDLKLGDEIRVSGTEEAEKGRPVLEKLESDSVIEELGEIGEGDISDLGAREEIRVSEHPVSEKSVHESDSGLEESDEQIKVSETKEAEKERLVPETIVPESDSDEESEDEEYDLETKEVGKKRPVVEMSDSEEEESKGKKTKKRSKKSVDFDKLPVSSASMNMTKKERREYLDQLRAENQRLLRETRDAVFEPVPLVRKPISSVLEKIRKRKEEISKQFLSRKKSKSVEKCKRNFTEDVSDDDDIEEIVVMEKNDDMDMKFKSKKNPEEDVSDDDIEEIVVVEKNDDMNIKFKSKQNPERQDCVEDPAGPTENSDEPSNQKAESSPTPQDPLLRSQTSNSEDEPLEKTSSRPLEEVMTPSVVTMNLKLNPSPALDNSEEEPEGIEENADHETHDSCPGDPVRKFIDEIAEEEDDSDNDLLRFDDEDEDDDEEDDDLRDMIVSQFKEDPTDKDRRNELHQKWIEQQDAAGTEKLLQKLKRGLQQDATTLSEDEDDDADEEERAEDADDEEVTKPEASEDEDEADPSRANLIRTNIKKIKEMMPLMFTDEDDVYVSSDDEEWEKKLMQQRLYKKMEQKTKSSSATVLENSEEILRHITKPEIRKKAKPSSYKEKALMGVNKNPAASKSSFLGRLKKSSTSEGSRRRGSNIVRGYIFERDDSNSKSANSVPQEPSVQETIVREKSRPKRAPAKFTASQSQERSATLQATMVEEEKSTRQRTTLFELLQMSSKKTCFTSGETVISSSHTESIFAAFKLDKKQVKR